MTESVLVTGGSGFIGTNLIIELNKLGYNVVNLSKHKPQVDVETIEMDMTDGDLSALDQYQFDYVVHLAAISTIRDAEEDSDRTLAINIDTTRGLLNYFEHKNIKKFILMSSITVYKASKDAELDEKSELIENETEGIYAYSKVMAEKQCEKYAQDMPIIVFRLSNSYGPYQRIGKNPVLIPQVINQALTDRRISVYNGEFARDFVYVSDVIDAIIKGMQKDEVGTFNIGTGKATKVKEIADKVSEILDAPVDDLKREIHVPLRLVADIGLIQEKLEWQPEISLEEGLRRTIAYYQSNS